MNPLLLCLKIQPSLVCFICSVSLLYHNSCDLMCKTCKFLQCLSNHMHVHISILKGKDGMWRNMVPGVRQSTCVSPRSDINLWCRWLRFFQRATCIVSLRNKSDFNHRAYNYIADVVVTDAVNIQPSFQPILQHDYLFYLPARSLFLSLCLTGHLC